MKLVDKMSSKTEKNYDKSLMVDGETTRQIGTDRKEGKSGKNDKTFIEIFTGGN